MTLLIKKCNNDVFNTYICIMMKDDGHIIPFLTNGHLVQNTLLDVSDTIVVDSMQVWQIHYGCRGTLCVHGNCFIEYILKILILKHYGKGFYQG